MKKIYMVIVSILGMLTSIAQVNAPYTATFDDYDGWDNNTANDNWVVDNGVVHLSSATASGFISFQSPLINTTTVANPAFQFDVKINDFGGCKPEFQIYTSSNGGASFNWGMEITVIGQTCSSADRHQSDHTWETYEVFNLPQVPNYRVILQADFFGSSGSISVDNVEFNTRDSLSINNPEPEPEPTAIHDIEDADFKVWAYNSTLNFQNIYEGTFDIYSIHGNHVQSGIIITSTKDISSLTTGIYIVVITDAEGNKWQRKIMK